MSVAAKRLGWGAGLLLLALVTLLALTVRIRFEPAAPATEEQGTLPAPAPTPAEAPLIIPVEGVTAAQLTDTWGQSRGGGTRAHHAIDILAPRGTPVLAAASGTVEKLFESGAGGHTIYIRTDDGATIHYYAHLDSYGVAEKQRVHQGEAIATVGNTGSAAGGAPHLHFEIKRMQPGEGWWQGVNVNPYPLLAGIGRGS